MDEHVKRHEDLPLFLFRRGHFDPLHRDRLYLEELPVVLQVPDEPVEVVEGGLPLQVIDVITVAAV